MTVWETTENKVHNNDETIWCYGTDYCESVNLK